MKIAYKLTLAMVGGLALIVLIMAAYPYFVTTGALEKTRESIGYSTVMVLNTTGLQTAKVVAYSDAAFISSYMRQNGITTVDGLVRDPVIGRSLSKLHYTSNPEVVKARVSIVIKNQSGIYILTYSTGTIKVEPLASIESESLKGLIEKAVSSGTDTFVSGTYSFRNSERFGAFYVPTEQPLNNALLVVWVDIPKGSYVTNAFGELTEEDIIDNILKNLDPIKGAIATSVVIGGLLSVLTILVLVFIVNREISSPIVKLAETSEKIADGEIEISVPHQDRDDEIGILAKAIERVRRSLEIAVKTLEEFA